MKEMYLQETRSTNLVLKAMLREYDLPEGFVLRTDFQSEGKGQPGNSWESEHAKNMLFSILLFPHHVAIEKQFVLSQMVSLAIKNVLDQYADGFSIKWPNDIYFQDKKIGGILIENSLQGAQISNTIVGIGLNINQMVFKSDAPNPISLRQITGIHYGRIAILRKVLAQLLDIYTQTDAETVGEEYFENLYRKVGFHLYKDANGVFEAEIQRIDPDGCLKLKTRIGETRAYYFKEVVFL